MTGQADQVQPIFACFIGKAWGCSAKLARKLTCSLRHLCFITIATMTTMYMYLLAVFITLYVELITSDLTRLGLTRRFLHWLTWLTKIIAFPSLFINGEYLDSDNIQIWSDSLSSYKSLFYILWSRMYYSKNKYMPWTMKYIVERLWPFIVPFNWV